MQLTTHPAVQQLVRDAAVATADNQRLYQRYPFFRSVTLKDGNQGGNEGRADLAVFARDISTHGIGLFHNAPFASDHVQLTIATTSRRRVAIDAEIKWCRDHQSGWYVSGGRLIGLSARKASSLFVSAAAAEANRRLKQRYPFLRPARLTIGGAQPRELTAWSTDISAEGIGLLHRMPLENQRVTLTVSSTEDHQVDVRTEIKWCERLHDEWYVSGGQFTSLSIAEMPNLLL